MRSARLSRSVPTATSTPARFARAMRLAQIVHAPGFVRRLHERAEDAIAERRVVQAGRRRRARCRAARRGRAAPRSSAESTNRRRRTAGPAARVDPLRLHAMHHRHRLGGGGRLVEQRRVGDLHPRQIAHHRLEIEERLRGGPARSRPDTACRACTSPGSRGRSAG